MPARFIYLENIGSPTRWRMDHYFSYLASLRPLLADDLQDLTAPDRYDLPSTSPRSMWHSVITQIDVSRENIFLAARNDYGTRRFEFSYAGVCKVQTTHRRLRAMPSIVVQELVKLRNGVFRHSFSCLGGDVTTIHALSLQFSDRPLQ
jgi:hypothetical protein